MVVEVGGFEASCLEISSVEVRCSDLAFRGMSFSPSIDHRRLQLRSVILKSRLFIIPRIVKLGCALWDGKVSARMRDSINNRHNIIFETVGLRA